MAMTNDKPLRVIMLIRLPNKEPVSVGDGLVDGVGSFGSVGSVPLVISSPSSIPSLSVSVSVGSVIYPSATVTVS